MNLFMLTCGEGATDLGVRKYFLHNIGMDGPSCLSANYSTINSLVQSSSFI